MEKEMEKEKEIEIECEHGCKHEHETKIETREKEKNTHTDTRLEKNDEHEHEKEQDETDYVDASQEAKQKKEISKPKKTAIVIIFEDEKRTYDLVKKFKEKGIQFDLVNLSKFAFNPTSIPFRHFVYYNRVSPSSFFRSNEGAPSMAKSILDWLQKHKRHIVNGPDALEIEMSKIKQIECLKKCGIRTPKTVSFVGGQLVFDSVRKYFNPDARLILKPNRGGSGHSVISFDNSKPTNIDWKKMISADSVFLVQEYVLSQKNPDIPLVKKPITSDPRSMNKSSLEDSSLLSYQSQTAKIPTNRIQILKNDYAYRLEIIGGKVLYVLKIDSSKGYQLCPCDAKKNDPRFRVHLHPREEIFSDPSIYDKLEEKSLKFCSEYGIGTCAIEFKIDYLGIPRVYDVNINTNYSAIAEDNAAEIYAPEKVPRGLDVLSSYLGSLLDK